MKFQTEENHRKSSLPSRRDGTNDASIVGDQDFIGVAIVSGVPHCGLVTTHFRHEEST